MMGSLTQKRGQEVAVDRNLGSTRIVEVQMSESDKTAETPPKAPMLETDNPPGAHPHDMTEAGNKPYLDPNKWPVLGH